MGSNLNTGETEKKRSDSLVFLLPFDSNADVDNDVLMVDSRFFIPREITDFQNTTYSFIPDQTNIDIEEVALREVYYAMLASEDVLRKEWDNEREDEAWALLQEEA